MGSLGPRVGGWESEPKLGPEQPLWDSLKVGRWVGRVAGSHPWGGSTPRGLVKTNGPQEVGRGAAALTGDVLCCACCA